VKPCNFCEPTFTERTIQEELKKETKGNIDDLNAKLHNEIND